MTKAANEEVVELWALSVESWGVGINIELENSSHVLWQENMGHMENKASTRERMMMEKNDSKS